jgi:chromosome segregation ATPase
MTGVIKEIEILEKRYLLAKEKTERAEADCAKAEGRLAGLKAEVRELQGYLESLKAELREKTKLLDGLNDKVAGS